MNEDNNNFENGYGNDNNNQGEPQYTQAPEQEPSYYSKGSGYNGQPQDYGSGKGQGQGLGIASMICGIIAPISCCASIYLAIPLSIAAIVLGIVQIVKNESKGMAIAGIVCGSVTLVLMIIVIILGVIGLAMFASGQLNDVLPSDVLEQLQQLQEFH